MEDSAPSKQPQRVVKVWSYKTIGNVTLLAMLTLVVLGLAFERLSISSALALGASAGFVVAAINWFRLGRRGKALLHLLISPAIYLIIFIGIPLLLVAIGYVLGGSADGVAEIAGDFASTLTLALDFGAAFLVIAYLYSMTKRDIVQLQAKGITVEYAGASLPPMSIAALSVVLMWGIITVAGQAYVASAQNHVYCELLQPGMTEEEVSRALDEIGPHYQTRLDGLYPLPEGVSYYRNIYWRDSRHDLTYFYSLWVGYDSNGKLVWWGREWVNISRPRFSSGLDTIQCPWTFSQSVTAR